MIAIRNLHTERPCREWDVKVDRSSVLGNPFYLKHESMREAVCQEYEFYFHKQMAENPAFKNEVEKLRALYHAHGKLNLFCWCAPKRCHAETIRMELMRHESL